MQKIIFSADTFNDETENFHHDHDPDSMISYIILFFFFWQHPLCVTQGLLMTTFTEVALARGIIWDVGDRIPQSVLERSTARQTPYRCYHFGPISYIILNKHIILYPSQRTC